MNDIRMHGIGRKIDHRLNEQYLNTYWRETGHFVPWSDNKKFKDFFSDTSFTGETQVADLIISSKSCGIRYTTEFSEIRDQQQETVPRAFAYLLRNSNTWILGLVRRASLMGYHSLGDSFFTLTENKATSGINVSEIRSSYTLAELLINEIASKKSESEDNRLELLTLIKNSEENIRLYARFKEDTRLKMDSRYTKNEDNFRVAEQGLVFGHPFHVISKASAGFSSDERYSYTPELGADFKLHYFAIKSDQVLSFSNSNASIPLDYKAVEEAKAIIGRDFESYILHPCHPWQAVYLKRQAQFQNLIKSNYILSLGELGEPVWPTSSVRTVYQCSTDSFLKLAINIKITNFVRNNPLVELQRAMDVSRLLLHHGLLNDRLAVSSNGDVCSFTILSETHCQTLNTNDQDLQSALSILFREGGLGDVKPNVLAYLLEENIGTGMPPVFDEIIKYSNHVKADLTPSLIKKWWKRYISISLIPLLKLYSNYGISLEAHLQNCMLSLEDGWPMKFYVRDLEGASINEKDRCFIAKESAACYSDEEAWFRFKYYVVVNHIGHFISVLSRTSLVEEVDLWSVTLDSLATSILVESSGNSHVYLRLVHDLSHATHLPAKMNMMSRFNGHSENPDYVHIPNPMLVAKLEVANDSAA